MVGGWRLVGSNFIKIPTPHTNLGINFIVMGGGVRALPLGSPLDQPLSGESKSFCLFSVIRTAHFVVTGKVSFIRVNSKP